MLLFRRLPWEFAVRNLFRRPLRSGLTFVGLTTVIVLVFVTLGFIGGLQRSLAVSGDPRVAIVFSLGMGENLEYSSIPARTADLLAASLEGIQRRFGRKYASAELYLASILTAGDRAEPSTGLVRGVTPAALLVRRQVQIVEGRWPGPGEVMVGRLAAAKLGVSQQQLGVGQTIEMESRQWRISGRFAADGSAFGSEIWCGLDDLQQALKRQDLSLVAVTLRDDADFAEVNLFCKERIVDLKAQMIRETDYYAMLQRDYRPVRMLAWAVALLVAAAGVFAGLNTMYGAVVGRVRELATLQTIGFQRRAILLSLIQEGVILAMAASLCAAAVTLWLVNGVAVRFTMGAFQLHVDGVAMLIGLSVGVLLGLIGSIPPAIRALGMPVVEGLRAV